MIGRNISTGLVVVAACLVACGDDDPVKPPPGATSQFENLTQREHVLQNLQRAYNQRNITEYEKLLDDRFVFFFSDGDVGGSIPVQWDRASEVNATKNMFNPNYAGPNPITSISLTLNMENLQWITVASEDPAYPNEDWYATTVAYDYTVHAVPDITFIVTNNPKVQFFLREIDIGGQKFWRLVRWRDLSATLRTSLRTTAPLGTEEISWGQVKALYN